MRLPTMPTYANSRNTAPRLTSRRTRIEQARLLRQTALFGGLAVGLALVFGLVLIPTTIRLLSGRVDVQTLTDPGKIPPQVPVFSAPLAATNSAQITLTGFGEPSSEIVLLRNGQEAQRARVQDDGSFRVDVSLEEGENRLAGYGKHDDLESAVSETFLVMYDSIAPKLTVLTPSEGQSIQGKTNQLLTVSGETDPGVRLFLNDRLFMAMGDGKFSTTIRLNNGTNTLILRAVDPAGNKTEQQLTVSFSE